MIKLNYSVKINATPYRVWQSLWQDSNYKKWSSLFSEGSYAESDWKEGSKIQFLTPEGEGMFSIIEKSIPNEIMTFRHLGTIKNFVEQPDNDESEEWRDARETYALIENKDETILNVTLDSIEEFKDFFEEVFPKALQKIKSIAEAPENAPIIIDTIVKAPISKVWKLWNTPEHIQHWYFAADSWHAPSAENDLKVHGKFKTRMEAKDGSFGFDFEGTYTDIEEYKKIEFKMGDGRHVKVKFVDLEDGIKITESFEPEDVNPRDAQQGGWQSILDNFKKYAEKAN